MRLGKQERKERRAQRARALSVPDTGGRYASAAGKQVVTVGGHFNHTGWSSTNARRIAATR